MNKDRRKQLAQADKDLTEALKLLKTLKEEWDQWHASFKERWDEAKGALEDVKSVIESVKDEEQEYYDNMPESLQNGDKGEAASSAVEALDNAVRSLEDLINEDDVEEADPDDVETDVSGYISEAQG